MRTVAYEKSPEDYPGLPEGYSVEIQKVVEQESGEIGRVMLVKRPDGGVARVFSFGETGPDAEEVSCGAWDDYRARVEYGY